MGKAGSALLVCLATAVACHATSGPPVVPTPSAALAGRSFGDTAVGVRILALDRVHESASAIARGKHLIVLAVVPGREIEILAPGGVPIQRGPQKGMVSVNLRRVDDSPLPMDAEESAQSRLAYDRCMSQAQAVARRNEQQRRTVKRDSTGKELPGETRGQSGDVDQAQRLEAACDRLAESPKAKRAPRYLPARAPAERYLVVLASDSEIPLVDLYQRLATLTAVAPDAATTIEAIAAGLYVGVKSPWGGSFVAW